MVSESGISEEQLCSQVLFLHPCSPCCCVLFELDGSKDIFLIWIRVHLFLLPSESLLCFPFHSALISSIMFPRHTQLYLPFVVVVAGFSPPDNKLHFVECFSFRHPCPVSTHSHAHAYTDNRCIQWLLMFCFVFLFLFSYAFGTVFYLCFVFLHFMFCRQLNGTGRFHGLASLDDITAIISTPPLGGFQVATPASPIWC